MCVIYAVYKNMPEDAELERGAWQNDDGAGICWRDASKKTIRWIKGLPSKVEDVKKAITDNKVEPPYAIHFRSASIGGVDPDLTHPFPVHKGVPLWQAGNAPIVLMHNGHIANWKDWLLPMMMSSKEFFPLPPWSDSRALALAVHLKGEGVLEFILNGSRVMILDAQPSEGLDDKDPENFFRLYGRWVHDKTGGYYQSIETTGSFRGKGRGSAGSAGSSTETKGETGTTSPATDAAEKKEITVYKPIPTNLQLVTPANNCSVWTIEELEALANKIEKEQADAALVCGL